MFSLSKHTAYGMSEVGIIALDAENESLPRFTYTGKLNPGLEMKVLGDDGELLPPSQNGTLHVRSPGVCCHTRKTYIV